MSNGDQEHILFTLVSSLHVLPRTALTSTFGQDRCDERSPLVSMGWCPRAYTPPLYDRTIPVVFITVPSFDVCLYAQETIIANLASCRPQLGGYQGGRGG